MHRRKIKENIYWMGAIDWDRRLFDSLVPLPDGTSYNAYLIQGSEKTVLLDTVDPELSDKLMAQLDDVENIDYIISNHSEQDHSGSIPLVLQRFPNAEIICSPRAKTMLTDLLDIPAEKLITVADGETLSLGDKTLKFIHTPFVHWPETMVTYLEEEKILFSCDFYGSHIATSDLFVIDKGRVHEAAKRYFAQIMMPFRIPIAKNIAKLKDYDIQMICPSHGQIYDEPDWIREAYEEWVSGPPHNLVVIPHVSMHDSTRMMVDYLASALVAKGVRVELYSLPVTDTGKLAWALVDAGTVVIGTPTVLGGPHPLAAYAAFLANAIKPKLQFVSIIGSYGWGGRTVEQLAQMISSLKVEVLDPVLCKGVPEEEAYKALDALAEAIAAKHREKGFV